MAVSELSRPGAAARVARKVIIVEDHELLAQTLALGLASRGYESRVVEPGPAVTVIDQAADFRPDLVLLDLDLGSVDGLELVDRLGALGAAVLLVTGCSDESQLGAALALGAVGWVSKSEPFEQLLALSERALRRDPLLPPARRSELVRLGRSRLKQQRDLKARAAELTSRERDVLAALLAGKSALEIAEEFVVSLGTVRSHIQAILRKLGVSNQLAAVAAVAQLPPSTARSLHA